MVHHKAKVHRKVENPRRGPCRSGVTKAEKGHRPTRTVDWCCRSSGTARGDVALVSSVRRSPYHQSGKSWTAFARRCFVECFIHENGNDSAGVIARWRARDSAGAAEPMCALSRRQSWLVEGKALSRPKASASLWCDALSREGSPQERNACRALDKRMKILQAWEAWSLAKFPEECSGPWQAGLWYPGSHCADSSPRAHDGHAEAHG